MSNYNLLICKCLYDTFNLLRLHKKRGARMHLSPKKKYSYENLLFHELNCTFLCNDEIYTCLQRINIENL